MAEVPSTRTLSLAASAPDFSLPDFDKSLLNLADVRGPRGLVVAFLCNHCPYVIHLAQPLGIFADTCIAKGVGFVGINSNDALYYPSDSPAKMKDMASAYGWSFPYLFDEDQTVARAYFAACTPDFYVFDAHMKLAYCGQFDGSRPKNNSPITGGDLSLAVQGVIEGAPPLLDQRPSVGCNIKWKLGNEPAWFGA